MTIEDYIDIHEDRIAQLDGFLRLAHLGRRSKESAVARKIRRRLIAEITEMLDYEREILGEDLEYLTSTTPEQRVTDEKAMPLCEELWDAFEDDFAVVPLLDAASLVGDDGRAFDLRTGGWYRVTEGYPLKVMEAIEGLGPLADLIGQMQEDLGITYTLDRYFWTENALEIWALSHLSDEEHPEERAD